MKRPVLSCLIFACLAWIVVMPASAVQVKLVLANGESQFADISSVTKSGVMWTALDSELPPRPMSYDQITHIEFPTPDDWLQANRDYIRGNYKEAIRQFLGIANNQKGNYYPAPGNYASLAMLRIIDCCRDLGQAEKIVSIAEKLKPASLPPTERGLMPLVDCWTALGNEAWEEALAKVDALDSNPLQSGAADRGYIRGMALEKLGKSEAAIMAYAEAYSLEFGSRGVLPKIALEHATRLLESLNDENRRQELQALVHTYAHVYSKGTLWKTAGPLAVELLAEPIDVNAAVKKDKRAGEQGTPVVNVRFSQGMLVQQGKSSTFEFKPPLLPVANKPVTAKQLVAATAIHNLTTPGVSLKVKTGAPGFGISFQRNTGLGVIAKRQKSADAPLGKAGEALIFSMAGVESFRVASITFSGGNAGTKWNQGDKAKLVVTGLAEGQADYPVSLSGSDGGGDAGSRKVPLAGGFITAPGGTFKVAHQGGTFGIDALALELKMATKE